MRKNAGDWFIRKAKRKDLIYQCDGCQKIGAEFRQLTEHDIKHGKYRANVIEQLEYFACSHCGYVGARGSNRRTR